VNETQSIAYGAVTSTPEPSKKTYVTPALTLFGHVAALTQSTDCSASNDGNNSCANPGGTNMGKIGTSDRGAKHEITRIGDHPAGFGLYLFCYKPELRDTLGHGRRFGVMADEVEQVCPEAVSVRADGYKQVHYSLLGITPVLH